MQTYYDAIDAQLDATAGGDRQIQTADAVYFDILDTPVRLWAGIGSMITPDGQRWHGFMGADENGGVQSLFHIEPLGDVRDGAAPLYEMSLHFLDEVTFLELRDMAAAKVKGRDVLFYSVLLPKNGTRALTPPGDAHRLRMLDTRFSVSRPMGQGGETQIHRTITVLAKNLNQGRSLTHFGVMSDTVQRARSKQLFDIDGDDYCQFTGKYANGYTIQIF
ncbi:hypothetical protein [Labrenzia sp. R5_0]|uniref:hypothetical protein n=1 Tax=Labrenzia sp. R5_0 TaxID=2821108 RepID=UPI001ADD2445|nr:hypothetical protein [Labrenzia sp. R5_0]MBO9457955.1 hypothetical protein [Labrenzia sp. R5_0]